MKQNNIKSQSQTYPVLIQQPTAKEMRPCRRAQLIADLRDWAIFIATGLVFWVVLNLIKNSIFGA